MDTLETHLSMYVQNFSSIGVRYDQFHMQKLISKCWKQHELAT